MYIAPEQGYTPQLALFNSCTGDRRITERYRSYHTRVYALEFQMAKKYYVQ